MKLLKIAVLLEIGICLLIPTCLSIALIKAVDGMGHHGAPAAEGEVHESDSAIGSQPAASVMANEAAVECGAERAGLEEGAWDVVPGAMSECEIWEELRERE